MSVIIILDALIDDGYIYHKLRSFRIQNAKDYISGYLEVEDWDKTNPTTIVSPIATNALITKLSSYTGLNIIFNYLPTILVNQFKVWSTILRVDPTKFINLGPNLRDNDAALNMAMDNAIEKYSGRCGKIYPDLYIFEAASCRLKRITSNIVKYLKHFHHIETKIISLLDESARSDMEVASIISMHHPPAYRYIHGSIRKSDTHVKTLIGLNPSIYQHVIVDWIDDLSISYEIASLAVGASYHNFYYVPDILVDVTLLNLYLDRTSNANILLIAPRLFNNPIIFDKICSRSSTKSLTNMLKDPNQYQLTREMNYKRIITKHLISKEGFIKGLGRIAVSAIIIPTSESLFESSLNWYYGC